MKSLLASLILTAFCFAACGQSQGKDDDTQKILTWFIKTQGVSLLYYKSDSGALYNPFREDGDVLTVYVPDESVPYSQRKQLKDLLTADEIATFRSTLKNLGEIEWKKTSYKIDVEFFRKTSFHQTSDSTLAAFNYLSMPVFLNKEKTKAFIGRSWIADAVIGGGELFLCEFKDNEWRVTAKVGLWAN